MLELGSMGPKRGRLQSLKIGIEIYREIVTKLRLSVEHEEETKSREKNGEKNTVISEPPADLKGITRCVGQHSGISPLTGRADLFQSVGFTQHLGGLRCNIWAKY